MLPCPNFHVALFSSHTGTEPTVTHHEATCLIIRCDFARRAVALREGGGIELKNPRHRRQRSPRRPSARGSERVSNPCLKDDLMVPLSVPSATSGAF